MKIRHVCKKQKLINSAAVNNWFETTRVNYDRFLGCSEAVSLIAGDLCENSQRFLLL